MPETYFCPSCGNAIDLARADCPHCGADVSAFTKIKSHPVEPDEENEDNEFEETTGTEPETTSYPGNGSSMGRWVKRIFGLAVVAVTGWAYQHFDGIEGIKNLLHPKKDSVIQQAGAPAKEKVTFSEEENPEKISDKKLPATISIDEFSGEWQLLNKKETNEELLDQKNLIIRKDVNARMVVYLKGYEHTPDNLNYEWGDIEGSSVTCKMSYKDDPANRGAVAMELSADKTTLTYKTLDPETLKPRSIRKYRKIK